MTIHGNMAEVASGTFEGVTFSAIRLGWVSADRIANRTPRPVVSTLDPAGEGGLPAGRMLVQEPDGSWSAFTTAEHRGLVTSL